MAKNSNTVKVKRGESTREFPKAQWESMKANGTTYGWVPASEISDEIKDTENAIEASQVNNLQQKLDEANKAIAQKDARIADLESRFENHLKHDAILDGTNEDIEKEVGDISDVTVLNTLLDLESKADKGGRKGAKEAIQARLDALQLKADSDGQE